VAFVSFWFWVTSFINELEHGQQDTEELKLVEKKSRLGNESRLKFFTIYLT